MMKVLLLISAASTMLLTRLLASSAPGAHGVEWTRGATL